MAVGYFRVLSREGRLELQKYVLGFSTGRYFLGFWFLRRHSNWEEKERKRAKSEKVNLAFSVKHGIKSTRYYIAGGEAGQRRGSVAGPYLASMCWNGSILAPRVDFGKFPKLVVKNTRQTLSFVNLKKLKYTKNEGSEHSNLHLLHIQKSYTA